MIYWSQIDQPEKELEMQEIVIYPLIISCTVLMIDKSFYITVHDIING